MAISFVPTTAAPTIRSIIARTPRAAAATSGSDIATAPEGCAVARLGFELSRLSHQIGSGIPKCEIPRSIAND
jgi:hypothetical protein